MSRSDTTGRVPGRGPALWLGGGAIATVLVVALVATSLDQRPVPAPSGSPRTSASASVTAPERTDGPAPTDGAWQAVTLEPERPIARVTPSAEDAAGVPLDATFELASLDGTPAEVLAGRVRIEPELAFAVERTSDPDVVRLRPARALEAGITYRVALRDDDDSATLASWAFPAAGPLRVIGSIPGDRATGVPVDVGIELTFDRDGVTGIDGEFDIEPVVEGRFETVGRTIVFVPARDLAPATVYTVTLEPGVTVAGSEAHLEARVRIAFETAALDATAREPFIVPQRLVVESPVSDAPVIAVTVLSNDDGDAEEPTPAPLDPVAVTVHRLPSRDAAVAAVATVIESPSWAEVAEAGLVDTSGLTRTLAFTAELQRVRGDTSPPATWFALPRALPAGWYVVTLERAGRDAQVILQVTDLAAYAMTSVTDSIVWVNRVDTGDPARGATVSPVTAAGGAGASLGTTGGEGLVRFTTPSTLRAETDADAAILLVRSGSREVLVPLGAPRSGSAYPTEVGDRGSSNDATDRHWLLLATDRTSYRTTDEIDAWGLVRRRSDGRAPAGIELRLVPVGDDPGELVPPVVVHTLTPDAAGAFAAALPYRDLPMGTYRLMLVAGGETLAEQWFQVTTISKPAFAISATTDRHVIVAGDRVELSATATFFDGTPVAGLPLAVDGTGEDLLTDGAGTIRVRVAPPESDPGDDWEWAVLGVRPAGPEEGEIFADAPVVVFPATVVIEMDGRLADGRARFTGTVSELALARLERTWANRDDGWDTSGDPIPGASVVVEVTATRLVRRVVGRSYDFIEKRVVDEVQTDSVEEVVRTERLTADSRGRFSLSVPAADEDVVHYSARARTTDGDGRVEVGSADAARPSRAEPFAVRPYLDEPRLCSDGIATIAGVGDPVSVTMYDGTGDAVRGEDVRYLFTTTQVGLRDAVVIDTPTFDHRVVATDAPNLAVRSVWFTGDGYVPAGNDHRIDFDEATRAIRVNLVADRASYRPGESVRLTVRTTLPDGTPVPATVILRGIDEKLYAIGAAGEIDPLGELYRHISDGLRRTYGTHAPILPTQEEGCGDTTGGGRDDFADSVLFEQLRTGLDGLASVVFPVADDLTSWRITAAALDGELRAGRSSLPIPVGLPFFVEPTLAAGYLVGDRPSVQVRAFGSALETGDDVTFRVSSATLPMAEITVRGSAFAPLAVPLAALTVGRHELTVEAETGAGAGRLRDRITRTFLVVPSRLTRAETVVWTVGDPAPDFAATDGLASVVVTDAGRAAVVPMLEALASEGGGRLDRRVVAAAATRLLIERFGREGPAADVERLSAYRDEESGLMGLLTYGSRDLELTARLALADPSSLDRASLRRTLEAIVDDATAAETRERRLIALAALAALREPRLADLRSAAAATDLTIDESLWLAIGAALAGDDATGRRIERALLTAHGERLAGQVRLRGDDAERTSRATALLAVLAAILGDPLALDAGAYVGANGSSQDPLVLERLAAARHLLDRLPAGDGRVRLTVGGRTSEVVLGSNVAPALVLTPSQLATLRVEPLEGRAAVIVATRVSLDATARASADAELERTAPKEPVAGDALVEILLRVKLPSQSIAACYEVTELVPSGLAVMTGSGAYTASAVGDATWPSTIEGQVVRWCVSREEIARSPWLRYVARVVTPGTYTWEPATLQHPLEAKPLVVTPLDRVEIAPA